MGFKDVMKKVPIKTYRIIGENNIDFSDIPDDLMTINSDFLTRNKNANREEKKVAIGKVNIVKFKKL